jgi:predicted RNA-binding Zn-ribbon protein involved in translation (DUF1610 family)
MSATAVRASALITPISSRLALARRESAVSPTARPAGTGTSDVPAGALFTHDTCPDCGFDGDMPQVLDPDLGDQGLECPDCGYVLTTRINFADDPDAEVGW